MLEVRGIINRLQNMRSSTRSWTSGRCLSQLVDRDCGGRGLWRTGSSAQGLFWTGTVADSICDGQGL